MNKPVRTVTPQGEEIVILSVADYEQLLEQAAEARDAATAEQALAEYAANPTDFLSGEEMSQLLDAATPVAFWRKKRGFTQAKLAERAGVSQAYLAQIESGKRTGRIGLYGKLSRALGVAIERINPTIEPARQRVGKRRKG